MVVLLMVMVLPLQAQDVQLELRDYTHDSWGTRDGLPHNTILDIAQSRDGYLWLATWEGLVRYNGNEFRVFDRSSQPALRDRSIMTVFPGRDGGLWFADLRGNVGHWKPGDDIQLWGRAEGLPGNGIDSLYEDRDGQIWIAFNGLGLGRLQPDSGRLDILPPAEFGAGFVGIRPVQDEAGRLWLGTLHGLMYAEGGQLLPLQGGSGVPKGVVWPYRAPDGHIWVIADGDLYRLDQGQLRLWRSLPQAGRITAMVQDRHGAIWLGTENRGILRLTSQGVETLGRSQGLPEGRVGTLFEDHEGSIWAGTNGGLYRLREALFTSLGTEAGLSSDFVRTLAEDASDTLWIGGSNGLDGVARDGRIRHIPLKTDKATEMSVLALLADGGDLWVGTYGNGLQRLRDGHVLRHYGVDDGLPNVQVRALARRRAGGVWIGTRRGVAWLQDDTLQAPPVQGMPHTLVHALLDTPEGLWIGAASGLYHLAGGRAEKIDLGGADGAQSVLALFQEPSGKALWASTDRGLFRLQHGKVAHVGLEQGLPIDAVFQMTLDTQGAAWMGSNRGMLRMDHEQLNAVADGRESRLAVQVFGDRDGMASAQGNGGSGISTLLTRDGRVWFATGKGAAAVQPARLQRFQAQIPPAVVIERLAADGERLSVREGQPVVVPAGTRRLVIDYAGLTYLSPRGVSYRTRLDGFDRDWVPRGNLRAVEFTSLQPGNYTLNVDAANVEGGAPGRPALLQLRIEPYWWQREWVRLGGGMLLLLSAVGLYRRRSVEFQRDSMRLERLVQQRTDDLHRQTLRLAAADSEKQGLLERLQQQAGVLEQQAYQDALTGLPNRRAFEDRIAQELEQVQHGRTMSLAMMDIDHFKRINDQRSHAIGDAVLRRFAQVLGEACRTDDFLARIGGEEFVLLLIGLDQQQAYLACERLRAVVEHSDLATVAEGLPVTTSIGVMQAGAGMSADALMKAADAALYRAKHAGRNRVESADSALRQVPAGKSFGV